MLGLAALVASIGIVDSLNPSTVAPALYLAMERMGTRRVASFIVGIVTVNLVGGLILTFGPGQLLLALVPHPGHRAIHRIELALGAAMLLLALALWLQRHRVARRLQGSGPRAAHSPALLGAAIAAIELPTAFPYFAVIAAVVSSDRSPLTQITLLLLFNAAFVLPLCVIVGIRFVAGPAGNRLLERFHAAVQRAAPLLIPLVLVIIAAALIVAGAAGVHRE
jgi:cytochrome c biogenesis protein CcdA